jgi:hypothetical protein
VSDREEFTEARTAGLKARHETRLARAQEVEVPDEAVWVAARTYREYAATKPSHPDAIHAALEAALPHLRLHETREARAIRREVAEDLRFLAEARKDYCHSCPEYQGDMHEMGPMALAVHEEHASATWLADIIEGKNDARGWLPSWRWDEWTARLPKETP